MRRAGLRLGRKPQRLGQAAARAVRTACARGDGSHARGFVHGAAIVVQQRRRQGFALRISGEQCGRGGSKRDYRHGMQVAAGREFIKDVRERQPPELRVLFAVGASLLWQWDWSLDASEPLRVGVDQTSANPGGADVDTEELWDHGQVGLSETTPVRS